MPRSDYLVTQMRVITTYLRLIVLPISQNLDYDYPIEHSIFTLPVFFSFLFLSAIFGAAVYLLYVSRQGGKGEGQGEIVHSKARYSILTIHLSRLIAFGILWFFITLSVESSIIPIRDVIFEHRVYLPSVGLFGAITTGIFFAAQRLRMERIAISVLVLTTLIFSGVTYARNMEWTSKITLWEDVVKKSPDKARAHNNLGAAYYRQGRMEDALREFQLALSINPNYADAHSDLGAIYYRQGRMEDALREFQLALSINPNYAEAHNNLGAVYYSQGRMEDALREFQTSLLLDPDYADVHHNLGKFYLTSGRMEDALREFQAAVKLKVDYADAHNNLGTVYEMLGRVDDAIREYQTSLKIDPNHDAARKNLERQK
jgi:Tfp pilus assembly protein PilF